MKKLMVLLLALVMVLSLCACGSGSNEKVADSAPAEEEMVPVISVEDCSIENIQSDSFVLHAKVRNHSDEVFEYLTVDYQLLDANGDSIGDMTQTVQNIQPGQSVWTGNYTVQDVSINEVVSIAFVGAGGKVAGAEKWMAELPLLEKATFYISDLVKSVELSLGDTLQSDSVNVTLVSISFIDEFSGKYLKDNGTDIYARLRLNIENVSKEVIDVEDYLNVKVDYKDGFLFGTSDKSCYLTASNGYERSFSYKSSSNGNPIELSPLSSDEYTLYIPCAPVLAEDETSPLSVKFNLLSEGKECMYTFIVR